MGCFENFKSEEFTFQEHNAIVVLPNCQKPRGIAIKTEYWGAFPHTEEMLLENGFLLCFIKNDNRWGTDADLDRKAEFIKFIADKYGLTFIPLQAKLDEMDKVAPCYWTNEGVHPTVFGHELITREWLAAFETIK